MLIHCVRSCVVQTSAVAMPSAECVGDLPSGRPCSLGKHGGKVKLKGTGRCKKCQEKRCRIHCRCARLGRLHGRARGRAKGLAKARLARPPPAVAPVRPVLPVLPVLPARPLQTCEICSRAEWWSQMVADVQKATSVVVASLSYDHPKLHKSLLRRFLPISSSLFVPTSFGLSFAFTSTVG